MTQQMFVRVVGLCGAGLIGAIGFGGGCSEAPTPTPEPVVTTEAPLIVSGVNNNVCGDGAPETCGAGEVTTCTTVCVEPVALGDECSPYPCQANSMCEDRYGSSCVRTNNGSGTWPDGDWECASPTVHNGQSGITFAQSCAMPPFAGPGALCPTDTYCKDVEECVGIEIGMVPSVCTMYQTHGRMCDGEAGDNGCALCAPGTDCVGDQDIDLFPDYDWAEGWCLKPCTTTADCPCEDDGEQKNSCEGGYCYKCNGLEGVCGGKYTCCDDNTICAGYVEGSTLGVCCLENGETCTSNGQCCKALDEVCFDGRCDECRTNFQSCQNDDQCCDGLDCINNECRVGCVEKECYIGTCKGVWACPENECVAALEAETCNSKDDDCDGEVDEDFPPPGECDYEFVGDDAGCQDGFETTGHRLCQDDVSDCIAEPGVDYCSFNNQTIPAGFCGGAYGNSCTTNDDCSPNLKCSGGFCDHMTLMECPYVNQQLFFCWNPDQNGTCVDPTP